MTNKSEKCDRVDGRMSSERPRKENSFNADKVKVKVQQMSFALVE